MSRVNYGNGAVYRRGKTWWIRYSQRGQKLRESSGSTSRTVAVQLLRQRLSELAGRGAVAKGQPAFKDLVALLERDYRLKGRRSLDRAQRAIAHLEEVFAGRKAIDITEVDFPAYQERRAGEGASPATSKYELTLLRRMFSLAVRLRLLRFAPSFDLPEVKNARKGFVTVEQLGALLAALPVDLRPVIEFAYWTGWRIPSEVLTLRWEQVDLAAGEVRLDPATTKNDEPRVFPFAQAAALDTLLHDRRKVADQLERDRGAPVQWVFHRNGRRIKSLRGAWDVACKAAKLEGRIMHDLRRSAVRNLVNAGVPELTAMKLTGHKTRAVFDRYNIVSRSETAGAVEKLSAYLTDLAGKEGHKKGTNSAGGVKPAEPEDLKKSL